MGKIRRSKTSFCDQVNPLALSSRSSGFTNECLKAYALGPLDSVRDQLLDSNIEEKINGLQALAVLSANKDKVSAICCSDIVRIASPLLFEKNDSIRNAAAGALRNISVSGLEVCEHMVDQDVLTPLLALLGEYAANDEWIPSFNESMRGQLDLKSDIFLQAINLLWNLCESTPTALEEFNHSLLVEKCIRYLNYVIYGVDITISVAQCLLVVSENNPHSWNVLTQFVSDFDCLLNINGTYEYSYLKILIAGIISNIPALVSVYSKRILVILSQTLEINHVTELESHLDLLQQETKLNDPELEIKLDGSDDETEHAASIRRRKQELPTEADLATKKFGCLIDAQRLAAEIITNFCSPDEEECLDTEDEDPSETDAAQDLNPANENYYANFKNTEGLTIEILEYFKSVGLIEKIWQRAQPLADNVTELLQLKCVPLLIKIKQLRIASLLCLQNLCNIMRLEDLGGSTTIYSIWLDLGKQVFEGPQDPGILEPSTSLMRSAISHLKYHKELFHQLTANDIKLILGGVSRCSMAEIRANLLRMLGTLGSLLPEEFVKDIIAFLLESSIKEEDVWTLSEAVDALMDMFQDNDWTEIVIEMHLLVHIKELDNIMKTKVRQQRRELNTRYPAVQTVRTNLSRFVKYIEQKTVKSGPRP